jgi:hypothetical protein
VVSTNPADGHAEPEPRVLSIRDAADATKLPSRSIRRRLAAGAFPGAHKVDDPESPDQQHWMIPISDLQTAGLLPDDVDSLVRLPFAQPERPSIASVIGTDRLARLRSDLAEAVAAAELAILRAEADKWRAVAGERAEALERADFALRTISRAFGAEVVSPAATEAPAPDPTPQAPPEVETAEIPAHVRHEAARYAEALRARDETQRFRWWRRRS